MFCQRCGTENPDHFKFCSSCGGLLETVSQKSSSSVQSAAGLQAPSVPVVVGQKRRNNVILAAIAIAGLIVIAIAFVGIVPSLSGGGSPSDVVSLNYQLIGGGQFAKAADLFVNPNTLQPLSESAKAYMASSTEGILGPKNFKLLGFKILSTTMVNSDRYVVSGTITYTTTDLYGFTSQSTDPFSYTVVKVNGQWRIVSTAPGY